MALAPTSTSVGSVGEGRTRPGESLPKFASKYLAHGVEPEARLAPRLTEQLPPIAHALAIPAYGEGAELASTILKVPGSTEGPVLIIVVLNESADAPVEMSRANDQSRTALREALGPGEAVSPNVDLLPHPCGYGLVIDRASEEQRFPPKQGVGLARKIGADVAFALRASGLLQDSWIHCSDADAQLPADYFGRARGADSDAAALLFPFRHEPDGSGASAVAIAQYETYLRYHVLGLRWAESPYAFQTIGSTLVISANAYAQVRGFPRRLAAEDFHMLNKLSKVGPVHSLRGEPIVLQGRASARVPFGTGAAVQRICAAGIREVGIDVYDPRTFAHLRSVNRALANLESQPMAENPADRLWTALRSESESASEGESESDPDLLREGLEAVGAWHTLEKTHATPTKPFARIAHERFDALRTLRLIHYLRDRVFPDVPLRRALANAPFVPEPPDAIEHDSFGALAARLARREALYFNP